MRGGDNPNKKSCSKLYCGIILVFVGGLRRMFVDFHNFAGSWGGKWFVALHCKTILYCVNVQGNVNSWVRVTHKINEQ